MKKMLCFSWKLLKKTWEKVRKSTTLFWTSVPHGETTGATITTSRRNTTVVSHTRSGHSRCTQPVLREAGTTCLSMQGLQGAVLWMRMVCSLRRIHFYFSIFVEGQICRRAFWSTSTSDKILGL